MILELFNFDGVVEHGWLVRLSCETFTVTAAFTVAAQALAPHTVPLNLDLELPLPPAESAWLSARLRAPAQPWSSSTGP